MKVNYEPILVELDKKVDAMKEISMPRSQEAVAKAVFTIASREFIRKTNARALGAPKAFHHIYEWGHIGQTKYKLYELKRTGLGGGNLVISAYFKDSKMTVPIPYALRRPGKQGRFVSREFIFRKKAQVMESGLPTKSFAAKNGRALVFLGKNNKPVFIRKPRRVRINRPGGRYTTGAFTRHFDKWFSNPQNIKSAVRKTGYYKQMEKEIARALRLNGGNRNQVAMAIRNVSNRYSKGERVI